MYGRDRELGRVARMSRRIDLVHSGGWTSTQVVRLVRALVCPTCEVRDVDLATAGARSGDESDGPRVGVRIDGRTVWLDERGLGAEPAPTRGGRP